MLVVIVQKRCDYRHMAILVQILPRQMPEVIPILFLSYQAFPINETTRSDHTTSLSVHCLSEYYKCFFSKCLFGSVFTLHHLKIFVI